LQELLKLFSVSPVIYKINYFLKNEWREKEKEGGDNPYLENMKVQWCVRAVENKLSLVR
jgi:hypothetical protein